MKLRFMIKCNVGSGYADYLYWNGLTWVTDIKRARIHETRRDADKELVTLSPPRNQAPGWVPEVFTM